MFKNELLIRQYDWVNYETKEEQSVYKCLVLLYNEDIVKEMIDMAQLNIRVDDEVKNQFEFWLDKFGMSTSTAVNLFAKAVIREKRIPFEIKGDEYDNYIFDALKEFEIGFEANPNQLIAADDVFAKGDKIIERARKN